jgi:hypothetical protein
MHWAAHGLAGIGGVVLGICLLATCIHSSAATCAELANCHNCTNLFGQTPWAPEKAASAGGAMVVVPLMAWHFIFSSD